VTKRYEVANAGGRLKGTKAISWEIKDLLDYSDYPTLAEINEAVKTELPQFSSDQIEIGGAGEYEEYVFARFRGSTGIEQERPVTSVTGVSPTDLTSAILVRLGKISREDREAVTTLVASTGHSLGAKLVISGLIEGRMPRESFLRRIQNLRPTN